MVSGLYRLPEEHALLRMRYAPRQIFPGVTRSTRCVPQCSSVAPIALIWLIHAPVQRKARHLYGVRLIRTSDEHTGSHHVQQDTLPAVDLGDRIANEAAPAQSGGALPV